MTREQETIARRKLAHHLKRLGWENVGPGRWRWPANGYVLVFDAVSNIGGELRAAWAIAWENVEAGGSPVPF